VTNKTWKAVSAELLRMGAANEIANSDANGTSRQISRPGSGTGHDPQDAPVDSVPTGAASVGNRHGEKEFHLLTNPAPEKDNIAIRKREGPPPAIGLRSGRDAAAARSPRRSWWRPFFGSSQLKRSDPALIVGDDAFAEVVGEFVILATRVRQASVEHGKRVILITSAVAGEGRSFVALNLAAILADANTPVVLVEADLRNPVLHRSLQVGPSLGLLAYLTKGAELTDCLYPTRLPGLKLLPAGGVAGFAPGVFASSRTRVCIDAIRALDSQPYILIDAPPVLAAPEVQILASVSDTLMMVVAANSTPRSALLKALETIKDTPLFGVVLNRFEMPFSAARAVRSAT
jgi:capsular exopolysaccharide synthesis family protein